MINVTERNSGLTLLEKQLNDFRKECDAKKECEEKYNETLKYSNQMLEDCNAKNYKKNNPEVAKMVADEIDTIISDNKSDIKKYESKPSVKNISFYKENKQTSNFANPFDSVDHDGYNRNNMFLITVESGLFNAQPVNIRTFCHDDKYRIQINLIEPSEQCLPMLLDTSIENGVAYRITKTIMKYDGSPSYSVIYTDCKVVDYSESMLDYNDNDLRTFTIIMKYKDYTYNV